MKHVGPISGIACHSTGVIATAGYDNQVILWNVKTRLPIMRGFHDHLANQCSFSSDGRYLVSSGSDYTARIWSVPEMRLFSVCFGHTDDIEMSVFHPNGDMLATCSRDHDIRIFKIDGTQVVRLLGHTADVISVSWVGDGDTLVSSSDDGTIRHWDTKSGVLLTTYDFGNIETDTIAITEIGTVFAGNDAGEILTIKDGRIAKVSAHEAGIKRLVYSAIDKLLVSLSYDRSLIVWKIGLNDKLTHQLTADLPSIVWPRSVVFQSENKLAFGTFGSTYATFDLNDRTWSLDRIEPYGSYNAVADHQGDIYAIGDSGLLFCNGKQVSEVGSLCNFLQPFGDQILTGGQMGAIFDAKSGNLVYQHKSPLNVASAFTKNGINHVIVGAYTGEGIVLRLTSQGMAEYVQTIQLDDNAIKGIACSKDYIFSVCATGAAAFHRISDYGLEHALKNAHDRIANGCAVLPGGLFASVSRDLKLRIWEGVTASVYDTPLTNSIKCVSASTDGRFIAVGSYGGQIAIFSTGNRLWLTPSRPTAAGISSITLAANPDRFLASSYDGNIYEICTAHLSSQVALNNDEIARENPITWKILHA